MHPAIRTLVIGAVMLAAIGCTSFPVAPPLALQRSLYPGLGDLDQAGIESALATELTLAPPLSGGLVWLSEAHPGSPEAVTSAPITEYSRTGVLEGAVAALRREPFGMVAALPTIPKVSDAAPSGHTLDALRSASARFQYEVALLLQTGTAEDSAGIPSRSATSGSSRFPSFPATTSQRHRAPSSAPSTCAAG